MATSWPWTGVSTPRRPTRILMYTNQQAGIIFSHHFPLGKSVLLVNWKTIRVIHVTRSISLYTHDHLALLNPPTLPQCYLSIYSWFRLLYQCLACLFSLLVLYIFTFSLSDSINRQPHNSVDESIGRLEYSARS